MPKIKISELVLDYNLYPRSSVDRQHIHSIADAIVAGVILPPIIVDKEDHRLIDGFHRVKAVERIEGENGLIDAVFKRYKDDAARFADAMQYNATHGRALNTFDRAHCIIQAERFGLSMDQVASALKITVERGEELKADRIGRLHMTGSKPGEPIPLKRTIKHKAGQTLSDSQAEANRKLSGMEQSFYVNQLLLLIESDLLNRDDVNVMSSLAKLVAVIRDKLPDLLMGTSAAA